MTNGLYNLLSLVISTRIWFSLSIVPPIFSKSRVMPLTWLIQADKASAIPFIAINNFHCSTILVSRPHAWWTWMSVSQITLGSQLCIWVSWSYSTQRMISALASAIFFTHFLSSNFCNSTFTSSSVFPSISTSANTKFHRPFQISSASIWINHSP